MGSSHTQWAPHRGIPPGQGGIEILAAATLADVVVEDVPVYMQHKFQQSLVLHSVHQQSGGYISCSKETGMHSVVAQKTVEIPQLQFFDLVVVPVLCNDKFWCRQCRKLWNCRRCSGVVDVTVIIQLVPTVQVVRFLRDSVRQSAGHSSYVHSTVLEQGC